MGADDKRLLVCRYCQRRQGVQQSVVYSYGFGRGFLCGWLRKATGSFESKMAIMLSDVRCNLMEIMLSDVRCNLKSIYKVQGAK